MGEEEEGMDEEKEKTGIEEKGRKKRTKDREGRISKGEKESLG